MIGEKRMYTFTEKSFRNIGDLRPAQGLSMVVLSETDFGPTRNPGSVRALRAQGFPRAATLPQKSGQQDHESVRTNYAFKRQPLHNGLAPAEFLPRVVPAVMTSSVLLASAMNQTEASQDIVSVFVLRCQPLEPAGLDAADDIGA